MKHILVIILSLLIFSPVAHTEESWKDYGHYKLVSLGGLYECPIKVEYILDSSDRLVDVTIVTRDKTACAPFQITTDYTPFSSAPSSFAATAVRTDVTIGWTSPGFDSRIASSISVTLYEDLVSRKCIFGSSDIVEKGSYSCLWGAWDCPVNAPGGLFPSI